jgi:hypothetical protein
MNKEVTLRYKGVPFTPLIISVIPGIAFIYLPIVKNTDDFAGRKLLKIR